MKATCYKFCLKSILNCISIIIEGVHIPPPEAGTGPGRVKTPLYKEDNMEEIAKLVSSVGFPIAMCILLFWNMKQEQEAHKIEVLELKEVISKNNEILASLKQLIEDKLK